jgi:hypothetical protein
MLVRHHPPNHLVVRGGRALIAWRPVNRTTQDANALTALANGGLHCARPPPAVPVFGSTDVLFSRYRWRRGKVTLRQLRQLADPHRTAKFSIKLSALFGMQARAEVMAY